MRVCRVGEGEFTLIMPFGVGVGCRGWVLTFSIWQSACIWQGLKWGSFKHSKINFYSITWKDGQTFFNLQKCIHSYFTWSWCFRWIMYRRWSFSQWKYESFLTSLGFAVIWNIVHNTYCTFKLLETQSILWKLWLRIVKVLLYIETITKNKIYDSNVSKLSNKY